MKLPKPHPSWREKLGILYWPVYWCLLLPMYIGIGILDAMNGIFFEAILPTFLGFMVISVVLFTCAGGFGTLLDEADAKRALIAAQRTRVVCEDQGQTREWVAAGVVRRPHNSPGLAFKDESGVEHVVLSGACSLHPIPQPAEAPQDPASKGGGT